MTTNFGTLVEEYATIACYIDDLEKQLNSVKEVRDAIKAALQARMNELGVDSAKSSAGHTVTKVTNKTAKIIDAEAFKDFILKTGDIDMLQNRASSEACFDYADANGVAPPGVELGSAITIRFNRSK